MCRALVFSGFGINTEKEMAVACKLAGAEVQIAHVNYLLQGKLALNQFHLIIFPGGFSFGDDLGAAKAFANRLLQSCQVIDQLNAFVESGKCILGVCNGFQLLVKMGLLPGSNLQRVSLTFNDSHRFENRWVHHKVSTSPCIFTKGLKTLYLPIRHGEGKFVAKSPLKLFEKSHVALQYADANGEPTQDYPNNPNGSQEAIAALTDSTGRVFGMMAHPEAALYFTNHPEWTKKKEAALRKKETLPKFGEGLNIFKNAVNYIKGEKRP